MSDNLVCTEKMRLLDDFEKAANTYSDATAHLDVARGTLSRKEYEAEYRQIEDLRMTARLAQETLLRHIVIHGC